MADVDALNDREMLTDTPIGDVVVKYFGDLVGVAIVNRHDSERSPRLIHIVEGRKGVLDAFYGKQFFADEAVVGVHARAAERRQNSADRHSALVSSDMRRELEKFLARGGDDAREAMIVGRR